MERLLSSLAAFLILSSIVVLLGCNTISGAGQDLRNAGEAITETAEKAKKK